MLTACFLHTNLYLLLSAFNISSKEVSWDIKGSRKKHEADGTQVFVWSGGHTEVMENQPEGDARGKSMEHTQGGIFLA